MGIARRKSELAYRCPQHLGHPHIHAVPEMALAHSLVDKTEEAYARGDLFAKRRVLMETWARYCNKKPKIASVIELSTKAQ